MKKTFFHPLYFHIFLCIILLSYSLYYYIDKQNDITELRLAIPSLAKNLKDIKEENQRLQYEIDCFESPLHLMELLRKPEFSYLKYPNKDEIVVIPVGIKDNEAL